MEREILNELQEIKKLLLEIKESQKQFQQSCDTRRQGIKHY